MVRPAAMATETIERARPDLLDERVDQINSEWGVLVFDNPVNTWEEVIGILQKATGCSLEEAVNETWEVHHQGRSLVHHADQEECNRVAGIIRTIGIEVCVEQL